MPTITLPASMNSAAVLTCIRDGANVETVAQINQLANVGGQITASGQLVTVGCVDAKEAVVALSGTFSGLGLAFEASLDGSNWYPVPAVRSSNVDPTNIGETASGTISEARAWKIDTSSWSYIRVRATDYVAGTASILFGFNAN